MVFIAIVAFGLLKPLVLYISLLRDSKYWQGVLQTTQATMNVRSKDSRMVRLFHPSN
jgi:hypothetical protein